MEEQKDIIYRDERLRILELLVDELTKDSPSEALVKNYMDQSGLPYVEDPVDRINMVLKALHFN